MAFVKRDDPHRRLLRLALSRSSSEADIALFPVADLTIVLSASALALAQSRTSNFLRAISGTGNSAAVYDRD